jgi:hypothetical protein
MKERESHKKIRRYPYFVQVQLNELRIELYKAFCNDCMAIHD